MPRSIGKLLIWSSGFSVPCFLGFFIAPPYPSRRRLGRASTRGPSQGSSDSAQKQEMKQFVALEHLKTKQLATEQNTEQKEFMREKQARRKYFAAEHAGPEKRAYMKDLIARRETLRKQLSDAKAEAKKDSDERIQSLRDGARNSTARRSRIPSGSISDPTILFGLEPRRKPSRDQK